MSKMPRVALVLLASAVLVAPTRAASSPQQAEKVARSFMKMEDQLEDIQAQIQSVLEALNGLTTDTGGNMVEKYNAFAKESKRTQDVYKATKKRAKDSNKLRDKYLAAWKSDQEKIQNPELKKASTARREELLPTIEKIKDSLGSADETMPPFLQDLTDLNLYLANNLTPSGIATAGSLVQKCNRDGDKVRTDVGEAVEALRVLEKQVAPSFVK